MEQRRCSNVQRNATISKVLQQHLLCCAALYVLATGIEQDEQLLCESNRMKNRHQPLFICIKPTELRLH